ncbi:hypothetical protein HPB48_013566 [Haemaphysalis longicornis]|uniref:Uncharacterized protein n=1 Tax=Haemaphysalis longicornis TaxID=44386 RepID=A0A9J6GXA8_HAELO|nr:hypothetical protein HPB48_013566 [Haemaphysalis longicornis]
MAAADGSSRGVVHGIPPGTPISELIDNLHAPGYEILTARMLGKTSTALVMFAGKRVPTGVIFEHAMLSYEPTPKPKTPSTMTSHDFYPEDLPELEQAIGPAPKSNLPNSN